MSGGRHLVLRRGGRLWGVPEDAVTRVQRSAKGVAVQTGTGVLDADDVLGVRELAGSRRVGAVAQRYIHARYAGFAVLDGEPVILVDVREVPHELRGPSAPPDCRGDETPGPQGRG